MKNPAHSINKIESLSIRIYTRHKKMFFFKDNILNEKKIWIVILYVTLVQSCANTFLGCIVFTV